MKVNIIIIFTPQVQNILVDVSCMIWIIGSMEIPSLLPTVVHVLCMLVVTKPIELDINCSQRCQWFQSGSNCEIHF